MTWEGQCLEKLGDKKAISISDRAMPLVKGRAMPEMINLVDTMCVPQNVDIYGLVKSRTKKVESFC